MGNKREFRDGVVLLCAAAILTAQGWYFHNQQLALCHEQQRGRAQGQVRVEVLKRLQDGLSDFADYARQARLQKSDVYVYTRDGKKVKVSVAYNEIKQNVRAVKPEKLPSISC